MNDIEGWDGLKDSWFLCGADTLSCDCGDNLPDIFCRRLYRKDCGGSQGRFSVWNRPACVRIWYAVYTSVLILRGDWQRDSSAVWHRCGNCRAADWLRWSRCLALHCGFSDRKLLRGCGRVVLFCSADTKRRLPQEAFGRALRFAWLRHACRTGPCCLWSWKHGCRFQSVLRRWGLPICAFSVCGIFYRRLHQ